MRYRVLLAVLPILLSANLALAAINYDSSGDTSQVGGGGNISFSFNNTGGNYLLAYAKGDACTACSDPTATYNGSSMTLLFSGYQGTTNTGKIWLFGLASPATGAHTLAITQGAVHATFFYGNAISYSGVDSVDTNHACVNNPSGSGTLTATASTIKDNDWGVYFLGSENTATAGTNSTLRLSGSGGFSSYIFDSGGNITPPGSFSMNVNVSDATNACMVFLSPPGPTPPGPIQLSTTTGNFTYGSTTAQLIGTTGIGLSIIIVILFLHLIAYVHATLFDKNKIRPKST
jgi:hypothetical protein